MRTYENKDELKNEINKVKIIFFDIDGTLLEMGKTEITPNMRKALCSLKQNGIKICIATGRPFVTIPMFEGIVFDAILAFNGSFCVAGDQVVAKCPIPKEDVKKIIENAKRMERPVSIATAEEIVANGSDKDLEDYFAIAHHRVNVSEKFEEFINSETPVLVDYFATWCGPCKMMHPILDELKERLGDKVRILKIDVDVPANRQSVYAYQIQSVPTLMLFKKGRMLWRQSGVVRVPRLEEIIKPYLAS